MKSFAKSILISGIVAVVTSTSMVAQTGNSGFEQWYRAKYGRPSPTEQVRLDAAQGNAVSLTATPTVVASANGEFEQWYRAKYGRPSPAEQARLDSVQENMAAPQPAVNSGFELAARPNPAQTPTLGKSQLATLIATANTPAEHERIAQDYLNQAQDYRAQAQVHEAMIVTYKASPNVTSKNQAATLSHCEYFAAKFNDLAAKSQELAKMHEQMATDAAKQ